jgi:transcriptional regulator NrdR family protein
MVNQVIKKDGSKEPFDIEKIKKGIRLASQQAGLDETKQNEITEKVTAKVVETLQDEKEVRAIEIRDKILSELDLFAPSVAASWRDYEMSKSKR